MKTVVFRVKLNLNIFRVVSERFSEASYHISPASAYSSSIQKAISVAAYFTKSEGKATCSMCHADRTSCLAERLGPQKKGLLLDTFVTEVKYN